MTSSVTRRPLPALVALIALLVLTGLVWWRVLHRDSGSPSPSGSPTCPASASPTATPATPHPSGSATRATGAATLPAPSAVTVTVLNATLRQGIAGQAQQALIKDGFNSPKAAANDVAHRNKITAVAQIRFGPRARAGAKLLRYYFPGAQLVRTHSHRHTVVVSLGDKYRHVAAPRAVRKAMDARQVTTSPTATPTRHHHRKGC